MRVLITGASGFIGTRLSELLVGSDIQYCNLDVTRPTLQQFFPQWTPGSVLDIGAIRALARDFKPTHLIHLAAETHIEQATTSLEVDYPVNCGAIARLAEGLAGVPLQMSAFVSTQFVCGPQAGVPQDDLEFSAHTDYGQSKVVMEQEVRGRWTSPYVIVRPTYVWGPHHTKYFRDVCRTLARGLYCHPSGKPVVRAYAYVDTVAQMLLTALGRSDLHGRVLYATDRPEDSYQFVNRLSLALRGKAARRLPRPCLRALARVGDRWRKFPMNSFRYRSMTTDYPIPFDYTFAQVGEPKPDLAAGAAATAKWYRSLTVNGIGANSSDSKAKL